MARKHEAEALLRSGQDPSQIAQSMAVSFKTVVQYLRLRVGEGAIHLSDIYFSFSEKRRQVLQDLLEEREAKGYTVARALTLNGCTREELDLFESLRVTHIFAGDMYENVSNIEMILHTVVRAELEVTFGPGDDGGWRKGISTEIRTRCAARREEDAAPAETPYAYTDLIDLSKIMSKNWAQFSKVVPPPYQINKKELEAALRRLNQIRNAVMHPVKKRKWSEQDFEFVRGLRELFTPKVP